MACHNHGGQNRLHCARIGGSTEQPISFAKAEVAAIPAPLVTCPDVVGKWDMGSNKGYSQWWPLSVVSASNMSGGQAEASIVHA